MSSTRSTDRRQSTARAGRFLPLLILHALLAAPLFAAELPPGFDRERHMLVDEVRPGMLGYGMTVFHGTDPEPFPVEVVSVQKGFAAGKSVVWIRCPSKRMQMTGPVQGMSGSPIYLWPAPANGQAPAARQPGSGGRMIGAFAFGHRLGKDCYVGVQPIENMLQTAGRMPKPGQARAEQASSAAGHQTLAAAFRLAHELKLSPQETWRLRAVSGLLGYQPADEAQAPAAHAAPGHVALPVLAGTAEQAKLLSPFLAPLGLAAVQAPSGAIPASPLRPDWIDPANVRPQPGGVFAIPLVFGALDMSAIGTTTEVLPDGTVLAFGHQFFAQGDIAVPMATGYVHFVQPNLSASFKLGGSLKVHGAVVRDESSAVAGRPGGTFPTVPMSVRVRWPDGRKDSTFDYRLVHHNRLLPGLVGNATSASLSSDTQLPQLNTIELESSIRFEDGRNFRVSRVVPTASSGRLMLGVLTPITGLVENQFGRRKLSRIETTLTVEDQVRAATIISATAQQTTARPGETLNVTVRLQPYRQPIELRQIKLQLPADLPDGSYTLGIGGGQTYQQLRATLRPHLGRVSSHAELFQALQQISAIKDTALYAVLRLQPANSLAIGRSELPRLPSSRFSLLAVESSTRTSRYVESIDVMTPTPYVVLGAASLPVRVRNEDAPVKK